MKRIVFGIALLTLSLFGARNASAASIYFNGFETNTSGWTDATRVPSGTGGITSASGSFHAVNGTSTFGNWGGYNYGAGNAVPTAFQEYTTGVNIFLDVNGGWAHDTRFDFSSAINSSAGTFLRDFIFNCGFYDDATGPGAGTDRFVCSASNNSQPGSAFAKNPARVPFAISNSGWYDFQTHFYNNGGVLAVDLSIFDASNVLVHTWTLSTATDLIAGVGGNRYGWFDYNQFGTSLAFDNTRLDTAAAAAVPEPATLVLFGLGLVGTALKLRRKVKSAI